jgi:hypothetical protein
VLIRDIARVETGAGRAARHRRSSNGEGEVVSGIAMARYGQNALEVIRNLKAKVTEIAPGLPAGVSDPATVYDRSDLIHRAIDTLKTHADRGKHHRRPGLRGLPDACAQRAGGDPDAAGGRADRLHRHARCWA